MMKNPDKRIAKEIEYMILFLRCNFKVFEDVEKSDLKVIMDRI